MPPVSRETIARQLFGGRLGLAQRYADFLATAGVERGLIGPREADRLWERHLFNCAVVAEGLPARGSLYDIGSGAGLPGVVLAIVRPELDVYVVESLQRRSEFLRETVQMLGLTNTAVIRNRAEHLAGSVRADVVTARAVAPLDQLAKWSLPLLRPGGLLLAMKGARAEEEVAAATKELRRQGAQLWTVERYGQSLLEEPTTVVRVLAGPGPASSGSSSSSRSSSSVVTAGSAGRAKSRARREQARSEQDRQGSRDPKHGKGTIK
jgi:16S rRNA (guanine527-N7)-methyltransferase